MYMHLQWEAWRCAALATIIHACMYIALWSALICGTFNTIFAAAFSGCKTPKTLKIEEWL